MNEARSELCEGPQIGGNTGTRELQGVVFHLLL